MFLPSFLPTYLRERDNESARKGTSGYRYWVLVLVLLYYLESPFTLGRGDWMKGMGMRVGGERGISIRVGKGNRGVEYSRVVYSFFIET